MRTHDVERDDVGEADIVLAEGYKSVPLQKIELHRAGYSEQLFCVGSDGELVDPKLVAVVSNAELEVPVPLLSLDDVGGVCDFIEENFLS